MKFIRASEEELELESKKDRVNIILFVNSFIKSRLLLAEAVDDAGHYNNNNDFCRALNRDIKSSNYELHVAAFMRNGKVYLKRVDV